MNCRVSTEFKLGAKIVGRNHPTYFIADIAANHDGDLKRAKDLIFLAAEAGADAAKFQHFSAETIVSGRGFKDMGTQKSHQVKWKKSIFQVYKDASLNVDWTPLLKETCEKAGIDFFTSPYSIELVDAVESYVSAYKIGSGDITWLELIGYMARKGKPVLIATGASTTDEVQRVMEEILKVNHEVVLMQCNTNYTGSLENMKYVNLNVMRTFEAMYPDIILGLSDHTPKHAAVLGAIALGARVIEKHFTDDTGREGPDHGFSMDPKSWREMVDRSRELEAALGSGVKKIEKNEIETVVLQRRSIRVKENLSQGTVLEAKHLEVLRPCPPDGLPPYCLSEVVGLKLQKNYEKGEHLKWTDLM